MTATPQVSPGDLITANLWNQILNRLDLIDATIGSLGGVGSLTIVVPIVYGRTLADARSILTAPAQQLNLGSVLDTKGTVVSPNAPGSASLVVIAEMPPAGTRVAPNTSIDLLVAAQGSGGGGPQPLPVINLILPASAPVGSQVTINGANFAVLNTANTVRFDTQTAVVSPLSNDQQLIVTVPTGITGAPVNPGDPAKTGVPVTVVTPAGPTAVPGVITVTAPVPSTPTITTTNPTPPSPAIVGNSLVITGTNFNATPSQNNVTIGGTAATVTNASTTSLTVTVPLITGLNTIPSTRTNVPLIVTVNAIASNAFSITVTRLS